MAADFETLARLVSSGGFRALKEHHTAVVARLVALDEVYTRLERGIVGHENAAAAESFARAEEFNQFPTDAQPTPVEPGTGTLGGVLLDVSGVKF